MNRNISKHPSAERLQALLEGELGGSEGARVQEHVGRCAHCSAELHGWRVLFRDLTELQSMRPHEGFADRVMSGLVIPEPLPLAARVGARIRSLLPDSHLSHIEPTGLQALVDRSLGRLQAARLERHVATCASCATEARSWRSMIRQLDGLERFAPAEGFVEGVMAAIHVPLVGRAAEKAAAPAGALAWMKALVPQTRKAWAALSGAAVAPAVTFALVLYAVFSHPTVTPGALASFVWWQLTDLLAAGWMSTAGLALSGTQLPGLGAVWQTFAGAPLMIAGAVLLYTLISALALRVLYRNLIATRPVDTRYAQLSAS